MEDRDTTMLTGQRLRMARKTMGYSQEYVARRLKISRPRYSDIERGQIGISVEKLYRFADFYQRPIIYFLAQNEPVSSPFGVLFRAVKDQPETHKTVAKFETLCNNLKFVYELMDEESSLLRQDVIYPIGNADYLVVKYAKEERGRLGLGENPVWNLREVLEEKRDIKVFFLALPETVSGMFVYQKDIGGCILVNASHSSGRQLFSLAHEYAHHLFHREKEGYTAYLSEESVVKTTRELQANKFAAEFLMPKDGIREMFKLRVKEQEATAQDIIYIADYFGVSFQALVYRLNNIRLIKGELRDHLLDETKVKAVRQASNQPEPEHRYSELPRRYLNLCLAAYVRGKVTTARLADLLDVPLYRAMDIGKHIRERSSSESV